MLHSLAQDKITSDATGWGLPTLGSAVRGLLARYGAWVRRLDDAAKLAELEPRLARDIGAAPGGDRPLEGFVADPRPLWGIGLTPQPVDGRSS
jgi:hypothetical protein